MRISLIVFASVALTMVLPCGALADTFPAPQERQLESIEELREVAKDSPNCGISRSFGFGDSRRFSREFSENVRQYRSGFSTRAEGDLHGYSTSYYWYHMWAHRQFQYTATGNASFNTPGVPVRVILGFVENYRPNCATGKRVFSATVNGQPFFADLDVYDTVGCNSVLVIAKDFISDGRGQINVEFTSTVQNPMVSIVEIKTRTGCNDPCPCWTPELVSEYPISRIYVQGSRTVGSQNLKAITSEYEFEISKLITDGEADFMCTVRGRGSFPKIPLSSQQAEGCRNILRPAVDKYYTRMTEELTQIPLAQYCNCWGVRSGAFDTERTSCSATETWFKWVNYGRDFYSVADADVRIYRPALDCCLTNLFHSPVLHGCFCRCTNR